MIPDHLDSGQLERAQVFCLPGVGARPTAKMVVLGLLILQKLLDNVAIYDYEERLRSDRDS